MTRREAAARDDATERCREALRRLAAANPEPRSELEYETPFQLLVAVMLSAQATDRSVNRATRELFRVAPTPEAIVALGEEGVRRYIRNIGLYNAKARHVVEAARAILERHGGQVPSSREALEALPGVGRKTANVVLNAAFGEDTIAVDTHIFRVANRTGIAPGRTPLEVERRLLACVPAEYRRHAHHWLLLHGRYVCTARRPACGQCVLNDLCRWPHKTAAARRRDAGASRAAGDGRRAR